MKPDSPHGAEAHPSASPKPHHVLVQVATTAGFWPAEGYEEIPENQKVRVFLSRAADKLHITDTNNWLAKVGDRELDIERTYAELSLSGKVTIDYGPREGGGGRA